MSLFLLSLLLSQVLIWSLLFARLCGAFLPNSCTRLWNLHSSSLFIPTVPLKFSSLLTHSSSSLLFFSHLSCNVFFPLITHSLPFNLSSQRTVLWCYSSPMPLIMHVVKANYFAPCISMKTCIKRFFTHAHTHPHSNTQSEHRTCRQTLKQIEAQGSSVFHYKTTRSKITRSKKCLCALLH